MMDLNTLFVDGCSLVAGTISSVFASLYESFQLIDSLVELYRFIILRTVFQKMIEGGKLEFWTCVNLSSCVNDLLHRHFCNCLMNVCEERNASQCKPYNSHPFDGTS